MDALFPFSFSTATAFYLTLYVLTLIIHVLFMNYVLAGSAYLAIVSLFTGGPKVERQRRPISMKLRDWMPAMLSGAITAGVAPLLFIQVLYKKEFYTANLLLFHRWMIIVPVLIVGFYLLYLLKSRRIGGWPVALRVAVGFGALLCFAFTGYSWTENHLLSTQPQTEWIEFYESGAVLYQNSDLLPRLAVWFSGSIATMITMVAWQMRYAHRRGETCPEAETRRLAAMAFFGIGLSIICGAIYFMNTSGTVRDQITGPVAGPYLQAAIAGLILQSLAWVWIVWRGELNAGWLALATTGLLATILGVTVTREAIRLGSFDSTALAALSDIHTRAAQVGGLPVFLAFFVISGGLIFWCFRLVRSGQASSA